ncbi:glycosyltransferase family 4 protein [Asticcacaulis machinosus]|uniref:Glycosyl transferase family 4 family protein n=1 Tax=Asticcacaulis machinosus TaxID=2984211 RepID=A0ABT5HN15_9CAUL|nr:glycosyl transferase family 4 family protein [Asticcacaulis machinosus]MDC7677645.1 glycosyl transferase family 4 family protein [Asticcacaulis machinosus]
MIKFWIIPPLILIAAFAVSALASAALTQLAIRGGPVDKPRARGSHNTPTATSGGMAIMAATALGIAIFSLLFHPQFPRDGGHGFALLIYAVLLGLSGALDDMFALNAKFKLLFQIALALGFASTYPIVHIDFGFGAAISLWPWLGMLGTAFWLVLGLNTINFMDGSNGLAIGSQSIALGLMIIMIIVLGPLSERTYYAAGLLLICVCALGAHLGFLPFNLPMGKVFQGDAGSLFGGALITGGVLLMIHAGVTSLWLGGYVLAPLLVDVLLTLALRAKSGARLFEAHKDHLYQQWLIHKDPSHLNMALRVWGLSAFSGAVGLTMRYIHIETGVNLRFVALVALFWLFAVGWLWLRYKISAGSAAKTA